MKWAGVSRVLMVVVVLVSMALPVVAWAQQEGLTLEGLAEQVLELTERVEALERLTTAIVVDGDCQLAVGKVSWADGDGGMHPATLAAYLKFSDGVYPDSISIRSIRLTDDGYVAITFETKDSPDTGVFEEYGSYVIEYWEWCEFRAHSEFWEEDYDGDVTYLE